MPRFFRNFDWPLLLAMVLLTSLGILMILSTALGEDQNYDLAVRQVVFALIGLILFFFISRVDLEVLRSLAWPVYVGSVVLLVAVFVYGLEVRGSLRWFDLGIFRLQPSELVKITSILALAGFLAGRPIKKIRNLVISLALVAIPAVMIFLQPDLGSGAVLLAIWLGMTLATDFPKKYLILGAVLALVVLPLSYNHLQPYQRDRLVSFLNPGTDPLGTGYNVIQSTIAVGSGGLTGRGFGRGTQSHLNFLPEHHTDFIFATLAEELGLVGALLLLSLFGVIIWRLLRSVAAVNRFGGLILVGLFVLISFQTAVNIGMNLGLAPITGITLPFVSYGGSSLITLMFGLGLAEAILRRRQRREIVDDRDETG